MRIIEQTADRLVLHDRPFGVWFTGSVFTLAGLFLISLGQLTTLRCDRLSSPLEECRLTEKSLFDSNSRVIALNSVKAASLGHHSGRNGTSYRIVIETQSERIMLGSGSNNRSAKERGVSQINTFLQNPAQTNVTVNQDDRLFTFLFGSLFAGAGVFTIVSASITKCVLDRSKNTLFIQRRSLLGTQVIQRTLREIVGAELQERRSRKKGRTIYTYRIALHVESSKFQCFEHLPLTEVYSSDRSNQAQIVSHILAFLPSAPTHRRNS